MGTAGLKDRPSGTLTVAEHVVVPEESAAVGAAEAAVVVAADGASVVVVDASTSAAVVNTAAAPTAVVEDTAVGGTAPSSPAAGKGAAAPAVLHKTLLMTGPHPLDLVPPKLLVQYIQLWGPVGPYLDGLADEVQNTLVL